MQLYDIQGPAASMAMFVPEHLSLCTVVGLLIWLTSQRYRPGLGNILGPFFAGPSSTRMQSISEATHHICLD